MPKAETFSVDRTEAPSGMCGESCLGEAERELAAFIAAVDELYGFEASQLAADYWIDQLNELDCSDRERFTLRQVTIVAASRLTKNGVGTSLHSSRRIVSNHDVQGRSIRPSARGTSNSALLEDVPHPILLSRKLAPNNCAANVQSFPLNLVDKNIPGKQGPSILKSNEDLQRSGDGLFELDLPGTTACITDGISHDLRNYLCAVYANVELMTYSTTTHAGRQELLEDIQSAIRSTIDMLDSLLWPSHSGYTHNFRLHSLNQVITHTVKMVRIHPDARNVELSFSDHPTLEACIDSRELGRAVYNLLLNACQAASRSSGPRTVRIMLREEQNAVQIRVIDNGPGVPDPIRRIFRKPTSGSESIQRTGLGLTIAQCAARRHGGFVELEESTMGNTVFMLQLSKARFLLQSNR